MITMIIILIRVFKSYDHYDHKIFISTKLRFMGVKRTFQKETPQHPDNLTKK